MIDVYLGKIGVPESTLALEFDDFGEASQFCDIVQEHYKEEKEMLYMAIDKAEGLKEGVNENVEIDAEMFGEILQMQAQKRY